MLLTIQGKDWDYYVSLLPRRTRAPYWEERADFIANVVTWEEQFIKGAITVSDYTPIAGSAYLINCSV